MQVKVKAGGCHIDGALGYEDYDRTLTVQAASSSDRIDIVVLRLNDNTAYRNIDLYVVQGTPATTPSAPMPTRIGGIYELVLAQLYVSANSSGITQERITDTRLNSELCGYVNAIDTVDTTDIFNQYQASLDTYMDVVEAAINETLYGQIISTIGSLSDLHTSAKTNIVTAVNELVDKSYIEITTTLITGATTVSITNDAITSDSVLDIYAKDALLGLESAPTISGHTVTITFDEAQETDVQVKVRVS